MGLFFCYKWLFVYRGLWNPVAGANAPAEDKFVFSDKDKFDDKDGSSVEGVAVVGFVFSDEDNAVVIFVDFEEDIAIYGDNASV